MQPVPNPLSELSVYAIEYKLAAFQYGQDAALSPLSRYIGQAGEIISGKEYCGMGMTIVNGDTDALFNIINLTHAFEYTSPIDGVSTISYGNFTIVDNAGALFMNFIRDVSAELDMSLGHMTFNLTPTIRGSYPENKDSSLPELIPMSPLIFHILDISETHTSGEPRTYNVSFVMDFNTTGVYPNYSLLSRTTVTSADSNSPASISGDSKAGKSYGDRVRVNEQARQERFNAMRPMRTIKDTCDGLTASMNQATLPSTFELNRFLSTLREDWVPSEIMAGDQKELPLKYLVEAGDYVGYQIDNRNMVFEQTELDQSNTGIRAITFPPGTTLHEAIKKILKASQRTGVDVDSGLTYRINTCMMRKCDGDYHLHTVIKQTEIPENKIDESGRGYVDTGEDSTSMPAPLSFDFQSGSTPGSDILEIQIVSEPKEDFGNAEISEYGRYTDAVSYGSRELPQYERSPSSDFFKSKFSGLRVDANKLNVSLENPAAASRVDYSKYAFYREQSSAMNILIRGNPNLLSDLARNPRKVAIEDADTPTHYAFPEFYPMYAKVRIQIIDDAQLGNTTPPTVAGNVMREPIKYYYDGYYHITKVVTIIYGSKFVQRLSMVRSDEAF